MTDNDCIKVPCPEPKEVEIDLCSVDPPEITITSSEIWTYGPEIATKGWELRSYSDGMWHVIVWEPSYWTGKGVYLHHDEQIARVVFALCKETWNRPGGEDFLVPIERWEREQLAKAAFRVAAVRDGMLLPPPSEPQPTDQPDYDDD